MGFALLVTCIAAYICTARALNSTARIYRGEKTTRGTFVSSFAHFGELRTDDFLCGGVLITWKYVTRASPATAY